MKKIEKLILALTVVTMLLAGCGSQVDMSFQKTSQSLKSTSVRTDENDNTKVLVVYYSSTGTTQSVAEKIAKGTEGDLFELKPVNPYEDDDLNYNDKKSRIYEEYNSKELQDVELEYNTVDDWDTYDTVFIGYPIWWGNASWVVNSFVQLNNFEGKTVIPFCTSASSGIGDSEKFLKSQNDTGNWKEGKRFTAGTSSDDVNDWIEKLEIEK